jgi:hypothetical protein
MHEWQILRASESRADSLGFVWASDEEEALRVAADKFGAADTTSKGQLVAVQVIGIDLAT